MHPEAPSAKSPHFQQPLHRLPQHVLDFLRREEQSEQKTLEAFWQRRLNGGAAPYLIEPNGKSMSD